jgi:hypothetical protein
MKNLPDARVVDSALRAVKAAVRQTLKKLNEAAAEQLRRGNYSAAEPLVAKGRAIQQFAERVDALRSEWKDLRGGRAASADGPKSTPLWAYYQPILRALVEAGGEARRTALELAVERQMKSTMMPGDSEPMARGLARWQLMIRRARKHMIAEKWIDGKAVVGWKITEAGRKAAAKPLSFTKEPTS